ncbi:hypothetical protein [Flavobacterium sp.]|uniref:hypothetical protein n=1 Tax=Flavobacterium sp. TaxID=239 RepID=UPI0028BD3FBB|nr:hypothetical protein [Flavobacterium sp.]
METVDFKKLSDQELLTEYKKHKTNQIINAVLIGFLVGISAYSAFTKGIGFFTFFPLFFVYLLVRNKKKNSELETELKSRNLK